MRALRDAIAADLPFAAGEVALQTPVGFRRWALEPNGSEILSEDALLQVLATKAPLRIDHLDALREFPRSVTQIEAQGLMSLLALPLSAAGGAAAVMVVAQRHGWAFCGAPLGALWPLAAMAGLCLDRALVLSSAKRTTELAEARHHVDAAKQHGPHETGADATRRALEQRLAETQSRLAQAEQAVRITTTALEKARAELAASATRLADLAAERDDVRGQLTRVGADLTARGTELSRVGAEHERLSAEGLRLSTELAAIAREREELRSRLALTPKLVPIAPLRSVPPQPDAAGDDPRLPSSDAAPPAEDPASNLASARDASAAPLPSPTIRPIPPDPAHQRRSRRRRS